MAVYLLWHTYELTNDSGTHDEDKLIGVFSSKQKANEAISVLKDKDGFRDHPLSCFMTEKYEVDKISNWSEGFDTVHWYERKNTVNKLLSLIGYLILMFLVVSNLIGIHLSNTAVIILAVLSAVFMSVSIILKDRKDQ